MPTYVFRDKNTNEVSERFMRMSDHTEFMNNNPHLEMHIVTPTVLCDPTRLDATRKYDSGFKEVLSRIHERTAGSILNKTSSQL